MKGKIRRSISLLLVLAMAMSLLGGSAWAAEAAEADSAAPVAETSEPAEPTDAAEQEEPEQEPAEPVQEPEKEEQAAEEPAQEAEKPVQEQSEPTQEETSPVTMEDSGTCGENLTWKLEGTTLTISGSGDMEDYSYENKAPWYSKQFETVVIGDNVTRIGNEAFYYHANLNSVTIPNSVKSIGRQAFQNCSSLERVIIGGGVTSIELGAFIDCSSLVDLTIPDSVSSIGESAFSGCSGLTSITIGNGIKCIKRGVFSGCSSLVNVVIPDNVCEIEMVAFSNCEKLESVTIGRNVKKIGRDVFSDCDNLTGISVEDLSAWCEIEFEEPSYNPLSYLHNLYVNGELVTELVIPDNTAEISAYAFYGCDKLTSVSIPDSVTFIGERAFRECSSLNSVHISNLSAWCKVKFGDGALGVDSTYNLYLNDKLVTELVIPNGITEIQERAFLGCSSLTSIVCPDNIKNLGESTFFGCVNLKSITFGKKIPDIGGWTFSNCTNLEEVHVPDLATWFKNNFSEASQNPLHYAHNLYVNGKLVTNLVIPDNITTLNSYTFYGCDSLTSVVLSKKMTSIGTGLFSDCSNLTRITIPGSVTSIGENAFSGCSSLTSVTIPDSVTSIGRYVFSGCSSLKDVTLPSKITSISGYMFLDCSSLNNLKIPNSVTKIGGSAFYGCSSLTDITIPNCVKQIGSQAFAGTSLTSIELPNGIEKISEDLFSGCRQLTSVKIPNSVTKIDYSAFMDCTSLDNVSIPSSVKEIWGYAFRGCTSLSNITISNGVLSIGWDVFYGCSSLSSITIPSSVNNIGDAAFACCKNLKSISVDKENEDYCSIDGVLFNGEKTAIIGYPAGKEGDTYVIPEFVYRIEQSAFRNCENLSSVTIPISMKSIDIWAFDGCSNLKTVYYSGCEREWNCIKIDDFNDAIINATIQYSEHDPTAKDISDCTISLEDSEFTYDGKEKKPAVTVKDGDTVLEPGVDYTVTYSDNVNAGSGKVLVTGIGDYSCAAILQFTIVQATQELTASISPSSIQVGQTAKITAKAVTSLHYSSNNKKIAEVSGSGIVTGKSVGTATITVLAVNAKNYQYAKKELTLKVTASGSSGAKTGLSSCQVSLNKSTYTYNGKAIEPVVTVKDLTSTQAAQADGPVVMASGKVLKKGKDYTVSYSNNVNAGKAKVTVTGKGNYSGKKVMTFTIQKAKNTITASKINKKASAKAQTASLNAKAKGGAKLTYRSDNKAVTVSKAGKVTLAKKFVGTATITITAAETKNYKATAKKITFTVKLPAVKLSSVKSAEPGKLTVKWAKNVFATGYQVQYAASSKFTGAKTAKISKNQTVTSTLSGLTEGKKYYVRVRAYKTSGKTNVYSAWSSAKSATVKVTPKPAAVKLSSVTSAKAGEMTVKWTKNAKINGYQVQYSTDQTFKGTKTVTIKKASTTNTTVKKLAKGKGYYVRVRTYQKVGSKTYYSAWSASKNVTIKK